MEYASKGVGAAGLTTGIIGSALGVLNGGLGGVLGGNMANCGTGYGMGFGNDYRYELQQEQRISELQAGVALRDANVYNDQKMLELYKYFDGKFNYVEQQLCQQNVVNAQLTANIACMQKNLDVLNGLTKTVIPITNICPQPMAQYNSWVAPTETATVADGTTGA